MSLRLIAALFAVTLAACTTTTKVDGQAFNSEQSTVRLDLTKDFPEPNSPIAKARIEKRVSDIKYQRGVTLISNLERLAGYGDVVVPFCIEGLKDEDPMIRMGCTWILGRVGNTGAIPALEEALDDPVPFVRYEIASQLGNLGARSGYRALVKGLSDERVEMRFKCFEALQDLSGNTFGYSHTASPEVRKVAVDQWESWMTRMDSEEL